mgnify:CR=1 FL=1
MAANRRTDPRTAALAKVHAGAKALALGDDAYRDLLARVTGHRSAKDCTLGQLDDVVRELKALGWREGQPKRAGKRKLAPGDVQAKARALWLSLYHLGEVESPEEAALDAFVKRQLGTDSLRFVTPQNADRVIEALKSWLTRAGVDWTPHPADPGGAPQPKARVLRAQWQRLHNLGAVHIADDGALTSWLTRVTHLGHRAPEHIADADADRAMEKLGAWIHEARARAE